MRSDDGPVSIANSPGSTARSHPRVTDASVDAPTGKRTSALSPGPSTIRAKPRSSRTRGHDVPPVLLSGDHAAIARWRRVEALRRTADRRPDLFAALDDDALSAADRAALSADPPP